MECSGSTHENAVEVDGSPPNLTHMQFTEYEIEFEIR